MSTERIAFRFVHSLISTFPSVATTALPGVQSRSRFLTTSTSTFASQMYESILNFWFGSPSTVEYGKDRDFWWYSTPVMDEEIRKNFENDYKKARDGEYDNWKNEGAYQSLALILLLEQVPRNIFRDKRETYATDEKAVGVAKYALDVGYDKMLRLSVERQFMYMPFMHSENLEDQKRAVELMGSLDKDLGPNPYAKKYYDIISKYGRFPHRNGILGRESTPQEIQYLKTNPPPNL